jgi:hypothetical protein
LDAWLRPNRTSQPKTRIMIEDSRRTGISCDLAAPHSICQTAGHRPAQSSEAVQGSWAVHSAALSPGTATSAHKSGTAGGSMMSSATSACVTHTCSQGPEQRKQRSRVHTCTPSAVIPTGRLRPIRRHSKDHGRRDEAPPFTQRVAPVVLERADSRPSASSVSARARRAATVRCCSRRSSREAARSPAWPPRSAVS